MPELPEVETIRRTLAARVVGLRVSRVTLARADVVTGQHSAHALLQGATVARLDRRGKQLAIIAEDGRVLLVHLGMSGQLRRVGPGDTVARQDHVHAVWTLRDGTDGSAGALVFRDPRRFGGLWTLAGEPALRARWASLGPDALEITGAGLAAACARTRRAIKAVLLDQRALAGVGNIYADEALFAARVHPARAACGLRNHEVEHLASSIRAVLLRAIEAGGSTLRDYVNGDGAPGAFALQHAVYGRAGEPCRQCSANLRADVLGQRTTVWCPSCQPRRVPSRSLSVSG